MITQTKVIRVDPGTSNTLGPRVRIPLKVMMRVHVVLFCSVLLFECMGLAVVRYPVQGFEPNVKAGIRHFLTNLLNKTLVRLPESGGTLFCGAMLWLQQSGRREDEKDISYYDLKCPFFF